jgi:hypothetical protein
MFVTKLINHFIDLTIVLISVIIAFVYYVCTITIKTIKVSLQGLLLTRSGRFISTTTLTIALFWYYFVDLLDLDPLVALLTAIITLISITLFLFKVAFEIYVRG